MKPRTRARALALQVLYETDLSAHLPGDVLKTRLEETTLPQDLADFARGIIFGVLPIRDNLDRVIAKYAPEWLWNRSLPLTEIFCAWHVGNLPSRVIHR